LLVESLESIPALAIVSNEVGEIVFANQQVLDYYGRTLEDVKKWPTSVHIVHPDDLEHANQVVADALHAGAPCRDEYRLQRRDGVYRWFEGRYSPVKDGSGRITNWYVLLIDIDDRRRSEERLREREAELARAHAQLTEAQRLSKTGSFTWDVQADEHAWSDEVYRIYGLDPGVPVTVELIQTTIHPGDLAKVGRVIEAAAATREMDLDFRIVTPAGELKYAHVVAHRIEAITDRPVFLGALRDVTESRLAEEGLARARSELAHVTRLATVSAMTASIAHEVSQPLSGILTNANTCIRMLAADPPNLTGAAETARRAIRDANRASDIVKRVRAMFARRTPTTELVDLNELAREVTAVSAGELQRSGAALTLDFAEGLPMIRADRVQLQQVVLNLLMNAADAVAQVEGRPRTILMRTGVHEDGEVELRVRDSGIGLDPQSAEKMFDAFYTTKTEGMGVGLAVSRSIIENHDGRLWATANDGPGATVSFSIPARAPSPGVA
jgi:PAS domain S-box-containing protein